MGIKYSEKLNLWVKTYAAAISKTIIKLINENNLNRRKSAEINENLRKSNKIVQNR